MKTTNKLLFNYLIILFLLTVGLTKSAAQIKISPGNNFENLAYKKIGKGECSISDGTLVSRDAYASFGNAEWQNYRMSFEARVPKTEEQVLYKQIDTTKLYLEIHYPENMDSSKAYPSMVFFFGGSWVNGNRAHFLDQAKYFTKRGIVCFLADYRTESKNKTTPFESLKDAKSAIRYIRKHAADFGIDSNKIIASGGSAGGHLACATALIEGYNDDADDLSLSCVPNALVLFNPVFDNGPGGYGHERIGDAYKAFSPLHNIKNGAPPTIIFLGTNDDLIPVETAKYYQKVMEKVESRCELFLYKNQVHGFFNKFRSLKYYKKTISEADKFLQSLGYLEKEPIIKIEK